MVGLLEGLFVEGLFVVRGRCHRPVSELRVPVRMVCGPSYRWQAVLSYFTVYPASQKTAVDSSDAWERPGTICAFLAAGRKLGMASSHVCVDLRVFPFGRRMEIGFCAICLLWTGASLVRKWPVAPVSLMAEWAVGVGSSSSSSKPASRAYLLLCKGEVEVGVTTLVVGEYVCEFILVSTNVGAPNRQARCGSGLVGMTVLCAALRET